MSDNTIIITQITNVDEELFLKNFTVNSYEDFCVQHKTHYNFLLDSGAFFNSEYPTPEYINARYWVHKNLSDAESVDKEDMWFENKNSLIFTYEQILDVSNLEKYPGFDPGDPFPLKDFYETIDKKVIQSWGLDKYLQIDEEFEGLSYPEEVFSLLVKIYIELANDNSKNVISESDVTFVYDNGTYSGDELNGKRHGLGIYRFSNGDIYEGEYKNDMQHGEGSYKYGLKSDWAGDEYHGTFKDDLFSGNGTYTWKDGDKYIGEWKSNLFHGQGIYTYSNGNEYNGEFESGKKSGFGIYKYTSGDIYEGEWKNDQENGQGVLSYSSGDKYDGSFKDGNISGYGTFKWVCGDKYIGDWKNNLQNGYGTYTYNNGEVKCGEWKDNELIEKDNSLKTFTADPKEFENINTGSKERVNNDNIEKTLVIKQVVWDDNVGFEYGLPENHFTISDISDLGEQWDSWYLQEFLKSTFFAELDADAMPVARFWIYKNIEDAKKASADDAFGGDEKSLPFAWNFYIPNKDEFKGFGNNDFDPGWNDMKEQLQVLNKKVIQYWGLEELINNPPQKFQEYTPHELTDSLIKIYIGLVNDKPKTLTAETKKVENITTNVDKAIGFQWEKIYNTEEMIALQAREEVFNYIFQYYKVEDVDDLTKKQINEIIKFRDQELSEFSNLKSGFNDLIGMWES